MDRRETIKSVLVGSLASGLLFSACTPEEKEKLAKQGLVTGPYGRTDKEKVRDARLMEESFFSEHELATIAVLCDLILPATTSAPSAIEAEVPEFIAFIVKDMPKHQLPMRGGIMWLDHRAVSHFERVFSDCSKDQQITLLEEIAYPDNGTPELEPGIKFFSLVRNLVLTGYYTSKEGIKDLGYIGNTPTVWDGVPQEVLDKHGLAYDEAWLVKCVDQSKREVLAQWDEHGNLIS